MVIGNGDLVFHATWYVLMTFMDFVTSAHHVASEQQSFKQLSKYIAILYVGHCPVLFFCGEPGFTSIELH